jgi:FMN phosphatase YigB (HAD superfamily)
LKVVALVDFGNTLADETWMRRDDERFPSWTDAYLAVVDQQRGAWDIGQTASIELAGLIGERLGHSAESIHAHMLGLCRMIRFYPMINSALERRHRRGGVQALVTVNPDLFAEVTKHYDLAAVFDLIITSWEEGTSDKVELCRRAMERLGAGDPANGVLIDNLESNVAGWVEQGGAGYVFVGDDVFQRDVVAGVVPGFVPADVIN